MKINRSISTFLFCFGMLMPVCSCAASTLDSVKSAGVLKCGVVREEEDYSKADTHGNRAAFDLDICKALSASILGAKARAAVTPYPDEPTAIQALKAGKVQVIATATPDFTSSTALGIAFSPAIFFDGEGFLVKKNSGIAGVKDLAGKKICFIDQTTNAENLASYAAREKVTLIPFPFEEQGEMEAAMYTANCDAMTTDVTQLANTRARFGPRAKEFDILPQLISKDPLAVAYQANDPRWAAAINWTMAALLQAEESGVTAASAEQVRTGSVDPSVLLYFGRLSRMGEALGLDPDWAVRTVKAVGNYGEVYERDLGSGSPLHIPRGLNALWNSGGLLYALPATSK